jgi:predicted XRE-type DNA-binding protein
MSLPCVDSANDERVVNNEKSFVANKFAEPVSDLLFTEAESKNLRFRLHLMLQVLDYMRRAQWTEQQAVRKLKVSPITIEYLMQRKIALLTTDQLLNMLEHCGVNVYEQLAALLDAEK